MATAIKILDEMISELELLTITKVSLNNKPSGNDNIVKNSNPRVENKDNKSKKVTQEKVASSDNEPLNVNALDLRVGLITSVKKHETAEKLYCEEIDVGEETPRQIASGLVAHYSLEQLKNRYVIVVCNLKPRNLVGFKSNGMVMCAVKTNDDGTEKVELLTPPIGSKPGDRVTGQNLTGEPLSANQIDKKKAFETLSTGLKVNNGIATWDNIKLVAGSSTGDISAETIKEGLIR